MLAFRTPVPALVAIVAHGSLGMSMLPNTVYLRCCSAVGQRNERGGEPGAGHFGRRP